MSDDLSTSFFSINGKIGRISYFFQNSFIMLFAFQYIYGPYMSATILKMQHNPLFKNSFALIETLPGYSEILQDLARPSKVDPSELIIRFGFIALLRMIDLKRVRDIIGRQLSLQESALIAIVFSIPFVDLLSTVMLMTLPSKKHSLKNSPLTEAHAIDVKMAQRERLLAQNTAQFKAGKISRADFEKNREKYSK